MEDNQNQEKKQKPKSKPKNKSVAVGKAFERWVCKALTLWYRTEYPLDVFNRVPSSGALRWRGKVYRYGDILPPEGFPFIIECKRRMSLDIGKMSTVTAKKGDESIISWWSTQLLADVSRAEKETGLKLCPMLIVRKTHRFTLIVLATSLVDKLGLDFVEKITISSPVNNISLTAVRFDDFITNVSPSLLIESVNIKTDAEGYNSIRVTVPDLAKIINRGTDRCWKILEDSGHPKTVVTDPFKVGREYIEYLVPRYWLEELCKKTALMDTKILKNKKHSLSPKAPKQIREAALAEEARLAAEALAQKVDLPVENQSGMSSTSSSSPE